MDERLDKMIGLISRLPADQITVIIEKCKTLWEISPRVTKLISLFDKLSDEEKEQFFRNVKPMEDGCITDASTEHVTESEPTDESTD
jgi:hypothetical protein